MSRPRSVPGLTETSAGACPGRSRSQQDGLMGVVMSALPSTSTTDPTRATLTLTSCHPKYTARERIIIFAELDAEIRASSGGNATLDNVLAAIVVADQPVNLNSLRKAVKDLTGRNSETLHTDKLPGCSNITREES